MNFAANSVDYTLLFFYLPDELIISGEPYDPLKAP